MSIWKDPPRLSEQGAETPRFLREALREARNKRDTDAQVQRIAQRLSPILRSKIPMSIATKASFGPGSIGLSLGSKILGAVLCVGIISTAFYFGTREVGLEKPTKLESRPAIDRVKLAPLSLDTVKTTKARQRRPSEQPQPDPTTEVRTQPRRPIKRSTGLVETVKSVSANPSDELALLRSAQQALDRQPKQTLELTEQHLRLYPNGVFGQEREMLAIEALSKLGRKKLAQERGRRFSERYPNSAHIRRIDNLLERRR